MPSVMLTFRAAKVTLKIDKTAFSACFFDGIQLWDAYL